MINVKKWEKVVGGGIFFLILPFGRTVLIISVLMCKVLVISIDLGQRI